VINQAFIHVGIPVSYKDVESIDPDFAKSLQVFHQLYSNLVTT